MTGHLMRWVASPHDAYCHALDPEQADGAADRGYAEARCTHTMPGAGLTITDVPCGVLCLPCATVVASELPDPGRLGRSTY